MSRASSPRKVNLRELEARDTGSDVIRVLNTCHGADSFESANYDQSRMELEESSIEFKPIIDRRPTMPEPPPVRLIAIDDVHVPAAAGLEPQLDAFYVGLLRFERLGSDEGQVTYKSETWLLRFDVLEPPIARQDFRPVQLEVPSLAALVQELIDREIECLYQRSLMPGADTILLQDPAGNWLNIGERRIIG